MTENKTKSKHNHTKSVQKKSNPKSFFFLLKEEVSVAEFVRELTFLEKKQIEIWTDVNVLELSFENGTLTFEDMKEELNEEECAILSEMGRKQIFACDYLEADEDMVKRVMQVLQEKFDGVIDADC